MVTVALFGGSTELTIMWIFFMFIGFFPIIYVKCKEKKGGKN